MLKSEEIEMTESNAAPRFSEVVLAWWMFFWRYAFLLAILLLSGGFLINWLSGICCQSEESCRAIKTTQFNGTSS